MLQHVLIAGYNYALKKGKIMEISIFAVLKENSQKFGKF